MGADGYEAMIAPITENESAPISVLFYAAEKSIAANISIYRLTLCVVRVEVITTECPISYVLEIL